MGVASLALGFTGGTWCHLVQIPVNMSYLLPSGEHPLWLPSIPSAHYGLFSRCALEVTGVVVNTASNSTNQGVSNSGHIVGQHTCSTNPDVKDADSAWMAAIVLQAVSWLSAGTLIGCLLVSTYVPFSQTTYQQIGAVWMLLPCVCQALIFLVLVSNLCLDNPSMKKTFYAEQVYESYCMLSEGAYICMGASFGYLLTAVTCLLAPRESDCTRFYSASDLESALPPGKLDARMDRYMNKRAVDSFDEIMDQKKENFSCGSDDDADDLILVAGCDSPYALSSVATENSIEMEVAPSSSREL
jgi:hypothetical protein